VTAPCISILMPVRNAAATLGEALNSIRRQTYPHWRLLLWDDGSEDGTPVLLKEAAADPRIALIGSARVGIVEALLRLVAASKDDWLARMDADDIAHPERLERQLSLLESDPGLGLVGARVSMFGEDVRIGRERYEDWINALVTSDAIARERLVECPIPHPTFLMRREAYRAAGGYRDDGTPEDYGLVLRLHEAGWRMAKPEPVLLGWRESAGRLSRVDPRYRPEAFRSLKRRHLLDGPLADVERWYQWGAGEAGKPWLREWGDRAPASVVDIRPGKLGQSIHGVSVIAPDDLPPPSSDLRVLIAVGAPGAREQIRAWLKSRSYGEGEHYWFIA